MQRTDTTDTVLPSLPLVGTLTLLLGHQLVRATTGNSPDPEPAVAADARLLLALAGYWLVGACGRWFLRDSGSTLASIKTPNCDPCTMGMCRR